MKLHKGLVFAVSEALSEIFIQQRQADRVVEKVLKTDSRWGARDRAFIASNIYEIVRWWRLIRYCADSSNDVKADEMVGLLGVWLIVKQLKQNEPELDPLPAWEEFGHIDIALVKNRYHEAAKHRAISESVPDWLDTIGNEELGAKWAGELKALNQEAALVLRVNTLRSSVDEVVNLFGKDQTASLKNVPEAVMLLKRQNLVHHEAFKKGKIEIQDAGSQLIAPFLDPQPGHTVIDACAGAGGKTLHLAALMENSGQIIAMDIEHRKLEELEVRARRSGSKIISTKWISSERTVTGLRGQADRLLLDVPCSGLGVLKRNPDSKWKLTPTFLDNIRKVQWDILCRYSEMVKPGGKMVYATCSLLPSESEDQVRRFSSEFGDTWKFVKQHRTSPAETGFDGFYMASFERI